MEMRVKVCEVLFNVIEKNVETNVSTIMMADMRADPAANTIADVTGILIEAMAIYAVKNEMTVPPTHSIAGVISMLNPPAREVAKEVFDMLVHTAESPSSVTRLFDSM